MKALRGTSVLGAVLAAAAGFVAEAGAPLPRAPEERRGTVEGAPVEPGVFEGDVRDLPRLPPWKQGDPIREVPRRVHPRPQPPVSPEPSPPDPLFTPQGRGGDGRSFRAFNPPDLVFGGVRFTGTFPPDPVGDVGPDHYIQMVNGGSSSRVRIFDKSGGELANFQLDSLAPAGSSACAAGCGDPIVLFDGLANRWLLSEFASSENQCASTSSGNLCVYISRTPDPVRGGFFVYDFEVPRFPDYPKYAVWPDAYYVSTNERRPTAYALQRRRMLDGRMAGFQRRTATRLPGFNFQALTPSDLDGPTPPPAGAPNYFIRHRDDEVHNPGLNDPSRDFLEIWEFHVDFASPAASTFILATTVAVAEFDSGLCGLTSFECFPQPGTGQRLDPVREVVMWRSQYRNFGSHETLVGNFVTDVDNTDHGGIRWYELRKTATGPWMVFQEGTHAPDADHRWMGSIAMDGRGDIGLGYSVSGPGVFPSIRYTGRLASDPLGTLPQGEVNVMTGLSSQTEATRWGDYSAMSVDPNDDCTFWYTNEFVGAGGPWATRIARFNFPECVPLTRAPTCRGLPATVLGTEGADILVGTAGDDVIAGLGGNDTIDGAGGHDTICAGSGNDRVRGGAGRDTLFGESGKDRLGGGAGRDTLDGGVGRDALDGGSGGDRCRGGRGSDIAKRCERVSRIP
jgi:RTX calcium-binding nonapeptide repeat (4 copies)